MLVLLVKIMDGGLVVVGVWAFGGYMLLHPYSTLHYTIKMNDMVLITSILFAFSHLLCDHLRDHSVSDAPLCNLISVLMF